MTSLFKRLSKIDKLSKYAVYGWVREAEKALSDGNVPNMIVSICIIYYHEDEIFDAIHGEVTASKNKKCISRDGWGYKCNYGIIRIPSISDYKYQWKLKIMKSNRNDCLIMIGVSARESFHFRPNCDENMQYLYCYDGDKYEQMSHLEKRGAWTEYGVEFDDGDEITVCLDLKHKQIRFMYNDIDQGIAYENVQVSDDIKYRLCVAIYCGGVEIIGFAKDK